MGTSGTAERRRYSRLLTILFVAMISLPLVVNLVGIDGADPGAENRELAALSATHRARRGDSADQNVHDVPFTNLDEC